jgi:hypothetical protein
MSGFFATYLNTKQRPLHQFSFLTSINEDPSSQSAAQKYLEEAKKVFVDTKYQK